MSVASTLPALAPPTTDELAAQPNSRAYKAYHRAVRRVVAANVTEFERAYREERVALGLSPEAGDSKSIVIALRDRVRYLESELAARNGAGH